MRKSIATAQNLLMKFAREAEKEYREDRAGAAQRLHESLVSSIAKQQADAQTVLYVLELLRFEVLFQKHEQLFTGPGEDAVPEEKAEK